MSEVNKIRFSEAEHKSGWVKIEKPSNNGLEGFYVYKHPSEAYFTDDVAKFMFDTDIKEAYVLYCSEEESEEKSKLLG